MSAGNAGMEKLIPCMNKILDVCTSVGFDMHFDFPQIAVVGCQSAGKSSVLENFVGRDFLPRGNDIVTRRPLILQLITASEEYGVFMPDKEKKFTDFDEIRKEIESATEKIAGNNKGISPDPINLHIYSPNVLNLTLIDLPGITKVPVGEQPADIENQIRDMIVQFISKENCLILAVSPANSDLANSDALKLAKEFDPDGSRTIGVVTKLDIMDEGTDARDILENEKLPLRRGYVGIVNRSQKDINDSKDISAALESEREFFLNHKSYQHFAHRMGTSHLQRVLNQQLTEHIREKLPGLKDELSKRMVSTEKELEKVKHLKSDDPKAMKSAMQSIIRQMQSDFEKAIGELGSKEIRVDGLSNGAIICEIFHVRLPNDMLEITLQPKKMRRNINLAIRNVYGYRSVAFEPYMVFENLAKEEIKRLKQPVIECIASVVKELTSAVRHSTQHMSMYPNLHEKIESDVISFIHNNGPKYTESILSLIEMEHAYMNTKHEEFMKNLPPQDEDDECSRTELSDTDDEADMDPTLNKTVEDMCKKLDSYMRIVKKTACDMVPKAITLYVIKELQDYIHDNLDLDFLGLPNDEYKNLFALSTEEAEKHEKNSKMYEACKAALGIIRDVTKEIGHSVVANK